LGLGEVAQRGDGGGIDDGGAGSGGGGERGLGGHDREDVVREEVGGFEVYGHLGVPDFFGHGGGGAWLGEADVAV
jgi:hypothetical protein